MHAPIDPAIGSESRSLIWTLLLFQTAALIGRESTRSQMIQAGMDSFVSECLSYLVVPPILLVLGYPIILRHRAYLREILPWRHIGYRNLVHALIASVAICAMIFGWTIASSALDVVRANGDVVRAIPRYSLSAAPISEMAMGLLVFSFVVPVTEEIISRGIILRILLRKGQLFALVVSSITFAVFHDPQSIMTAFAIGLYLGMLYLRTDKLWMPIIVHAIYNASAIFHRRWLEGTWIGMDGDPRVSAVGLGALAICMVGIWLAYLLTTPKNIIGARSASR